MQARLLSGFGFAFLEQADGTIDHLDDAWMILSMSEPEASS